MVEHGHKTETIENTVPCLGLTTGSEGVNGKVEVVFPRFRLVVGSGLPENGWVRLVVLALKGQTWSVKRVLVQ